MDLPPWLWATDPLMVAVTALGIYAAVIVSARINGLRSFSTMSGFDFVMTVAIGSLVATTLLNPRPSLAEGVLGLAVLFLLQHTVSWARNHGRLAHKWVDNEPLLLMRDGEVLEENLRRGKITRDDLVAKLRENGVRRFAEVAVVVMETTGTVSVIKQDEARKMAEEMLRGVRT